MKCPHRPPSQLGYMEAHSDATERLKRGERQLRCPACGLMVWENLYRINPSDWKYLARVEAEERSKT